MSSSPTDCPGSKKATATSATELGQSLREQEGSADLPDGERRDSWLFSNLGFKRRQILVLRGSSASSIGIEWMETELVK